MHPPFMVVMAAGLALALIGIVGLWFSNSKVWAAWVLGIGALIVVGGVAGDAVSVAHRVNAPFNHEKPALVRELHQLGYTEVRDMVPINGGYQAYATTPDGKARVLLTFTKKDGSNLVVTSEYTPHRPSMT